MKCNDCLKTVYCECCGKKISQPYNPHKYYPTPWSPAQPYITWSWNDKQKDFYTRLTSTVNTTIWCDGIHS